MGSSASQFCLGIKMLIHHLKSVQEFAFKYTLVSLFFHSKCIALNVFWYGLDLSQGLHRNIWGMQTLAEKLVQDCMLRSKHHTIWNGASFGPQGFHVVVAHVFTQLCVFYSDQLSFVIGLIKGKNRRIIWKGDCPLPYVLLNHGLGGNWRKQIPVWKYTFSRTPTLMQSGKCGSGKFALEFSQKEFPNNLSSQVAPVCSSQVFLLIIETWALKLPQQIFQHDMKVSCKESKDSVDIVSYQKLETGFWKKMTISTYFGLASYVSNCNFKCFIPTFYYTLIFIFSLLVEEKGKCL